MAFWVMLSYKMDFIITPGDTQTLVSGADVLILIFLSLWQALLTTFCVNWDAISDFILKRAPFWTALDLASAATFTQRWKEVSVSIDQVCQADDTTGRTLVKAMA